MTSFLARSSLRLGSLSFSANSSNLAKLGHRPEYGYILRISQQFLASDSKSAVSALPKEAFDKMTKNNKVVIFMKGVPEEPKCGFSNAVVQILRMHGVDKYDAHDVLKDEAIRQGIKEYTNWPTIPQIFINGEFVGGCDIMIQLHQNGDLVKELDKAGITSALTEKDSAEGKSKEK